MAIGETWDRATAQATAATVARHSRGKLVAFLAARSGDVAAAEDALSDAFAAALARGPSVGLRERPQRGHRGANGAPRTGLPGAAAVTARLSCDSSKSMAKLMKSRRNWLSLTDTVDNCVDNESQN